MWIFTFKSRSIAITAMLALLVLSLLIQSNQADAAYVPAIKLPWRQASNPIRFTGGPHGAPVDFPCSSSALRQVTRQSGLDFGLAANTDVLAAAGGWVIAARQVTDARGPNIVTIDHGSGFMTQYWHLNQTTASLNTWIPQGTKVGASGTPVGGSAHLHLEYRYFRQPPPFPGYPRDGSAGVPYPAHGVSIDGYTARTLVRTSDNQGWNYRGTLTKGTESAQVISMQDNYDKCTNLPVADRYVWEWEGATSTARSHPTNDLVYSSNLLQPPAPTARVDVMDVWTADNNYVKRTSFDPGQPFLELVTFNNTTGGNATANITLETVGPRQLHYLNGNLTLPPGPSTWSLPVTTPDLSNEWQGGYYFRVRANYNTRTSGKESLFTLTGALPSYYIIFTWDGSIGDQDAHLWLPDEGTASYHVFYNAKGNLNGYPWAALDQDVTSTSGMEVIGIRQLRPGTYTFAIYNFRNNRPLADTLAAVRVYQGSQLLTVPNSSPAQQMEFRIPSSGVGRWWDVFRLTSDGTKITGIEVKNVITDTYPGPYSVTRIGTAETRDDLAKKPLPAQQSMPLQSILEMVNEANTP